MIYADFECILVPEYNGKKIPEESYTSKYQKHVTCSYGYKLACDDDKCSESFKSDLGKDSVYHFINSMVKDDKYFKQKIQKFKVRRDHCHVTGSYRGSAHRDCNINVKLNRKIPIAFRNPKNYGSHFIMQELGKFDFKINVVPNELQNK